MLFLCFPDLFSPSVMSHKYKSLLLNMPVRHIISKVTMMIMMTIMRMKMMTMMKFMLLMII